MSGSDLVDLSKIGGIFKKGCVIMCLPILRVVLQFHDEEILKGYFFLHIIGMAKFVSYQEALSNFQSQDEF